MEKARRAQLHILIVILVVALLAIAGYFFREHYNTTHLPKKSSAPIVVPYTTVTETKWHQQAYAIGTIKAERNVTLAAQVNGRITAFYAKSGQTVKAGQELVRINPSVLTAALKRAEANLKLSQHDYQRAAKLYKEKAISQAALQKALYTMQADQANVTHAEAQLKLTLIKAPFAGKFGLKQVYVGDYLHTGDAVATLQATNQYRVDFSLPGRYSSQIKNGDSVSLSSNAFTGTISGKIFAINAELDATTRTLDVRALVDRKNLIPNTYCDVIVTFGKAAPVLTLPQTAVTKSVDGDYVYLVQNGKAVKTIIHGLQRRGSVIAIKGLKAGDTVINGGQNKITNGSSVTDKGALL
jgi:membrane fusion protein (multidrug efflux system)